MPYPPLSTKNSNSRILNSYSYKEQACNATYNSKEKIACFTLLYPKLQKIFNQNTKLT